MTIVIGAASPDGIVLAADSRTTYVDGDRHRIATDAAEKVFELFERFGVATYGWAFLGDQTVKGVMDEFVAAHPQLVEDDLKACATALGEFFSDRFMTAYPEYEINEDEGWPLGFVVAGYDKAGIGHVLEVGVPQRTVSDPGVTTSTRAMLWRGQTDVVQRLIKGVDYFALAGTGVTFDDHQAESLAKLEYVLLLPTTLQDAAEMAAILVRTTIDMQRFSDGTAVAPGSVPGCGGRTVMLAVRPEAVEWIKPPPPITGLVSG